MGRQDPQTPPLEPWAVMLTCPNCGQILTQGEIDKKRCYSCDSPVHYYPLPPMSDENPLSRIPHDDPTSPNNTERLLGRHSAITDAARALMAKKNHDYAGAGGDTPFRNFQMADSLGVCTVEAGIILRMGDKLQRLATFATDGKLAVTSETTFDAVVDIINYAVILQAYIESKEGE